MRDDHALILGRARGRSFLLAASDLMEIIPPEPVRPLPGTIPGIAGVVLYGGEFLPTLAWEQLPGPGGSESPTQAMAVLKRRLVLPLEHLDGDLEGELDSWEQAPPGDDPWALFLSCQYHVQDLRLPLIDADKLISWLHDCRGGR